MVFLFVLLAVSTWAALSAALSFAVTKRLKTAPVRRLLALTLWVVLLPLPVIDELIGAMQFARLCGDYQQVHVAVTATTGRTVFLEASPTSSVEGTLIPVLIQPWRFVDANTRELVVSFNTLSAGAGRLAQISRISESGTPLTFHGTCLPSNAPMSEKAFSRLGIALYESPIFKARK